MLLCAHTAASDLWYRAGLGEKSQRGPGLPEATNGRSKVKSQKSKLELKSLSFSTLLRDASSACDLQFSSGANRWVSTNFSLCSILAGMLGLEIASGIMGARNDEEDEIPRS